MIYSLRIRESIYGTNSSLNSAQTLPDSSQDDAVEIDLFQLIRAIFKRIKLCIGICGAAIICGLLYCFMATPTYLANCRMLVEQGKLSVTEVRDVYSKPSSSTRDFVSTQIKLITSDNILESVYRHFNFASNPAFANAKEPLKALEKRVVVKQLPNTNLIDLGFKDSDPQISAAVTNFIAQEFINDANNRQTNISRLALKQLEAELATMEKKRLDAIDKLNNFRKQNNIVSLDVSRSIQTNRVQDLHSKLFTAKQQLAEQEILVDEMKQWQKQKDRPLDSLPAVMDNKTLSDLKVARVEALANSQLNTQGNRSSVLAQIDQSIAAEVDNIIVSANTRLERIRATIARLEQDAAAADSELDKLMLIADKYKLLDENLKSSEKAYQLVLNRVSELNITQSTSSLNASYQVIFPAVPPTRAAFPQKAKTMIIVALAAGVLSVLICVLLELLDASVKSRQDIERSGRVPVFGAIPFVRGASKNNSAFVSYEDPASPAAEAFRGLRTSLALSEQARNAKLISVTSPACGEGRTFAALNLATSYAKVGKRVLLVDCDMRNRRLTSLISETEKETSGLSSLLAGTARFEEIPSLTQKPFADLPLEFLPSGPLAPNPAELLAGELTPALFEALAQSYDLVILDTTSVLGVSDTPSLACVPGMTFLVVSRLYQTQKKDLTATVNTLASVNGSIIGSIMLQNEGGDDAEFVTSYGTRRKPWYKRLFRTA